MPAELPNPDIEADLVDLTDVPFSRLFENLSDLEADTAFAHALRRVIEAASSDALEAISAFNNAF
ncbi:MAG TPA: hypothetical protein DGG94_09305 [Micromonosporaceae bacterium]|nr:hypothetical protein [Micromonosporaceae bacterium]HCU49979.1 hypothetical protein [Micromonosporaceae bacterium]